MTPSFKATRCPATMRWRSPVFRHLRINHSKLFAAGKNHINGIENFWNQAKHHLRKFNGVPKAHFQLFLK